jgi:putative membrane protein
VKTEGEGQLRDRLARERTKLAIERTFLAYVRTALAFIVVGIPALWMFESLAIQVLGWASILLGIGMAVFSISRYATVKRVLLESPPLDGDETDA